MLLSPHAARTEIGQRKTVYRLELGRCTAVQSDNLAGMLLRPGMSEAKARYYEAEAEAEAEAEKNCKAKAEARDIA